MILWEFVSFSLYLYMYIPPDVLSSFLQPLHFQLWCPSLLQCTLTANKRVHVHIVGRMY